MLLTHDPAWADDTDKAIEAITKLGGTFERDEATDGKPITKVNLAGTKANDATLKLLAKLPKLESLDLQETVVTSPGISVLKSVASLRELNLAVTKVTDASVANLAKAHEGLTITRTANLERLQSRAAKVRPPPEVSIKVEVDAAARENIVSVDLEKTTKDGDAVLQRIIELLPDLTHLTIAAESVTDRGFAQVRRLTNLQRISLTSPNVNDAWLASLQGMQSIKGIYIRRISNPSPQDLLQGMWVPTKAVITDGAFANAKSWPNLEWFDFYEAGFVRWDGSRPVFGSLITDRTAANLSACKKLKRVAIRSGLLDDNQITDETVRQLASLPQIESLTLEHVRRVTDASVQNISKMRQLKQLHVFGTKISPQGIEQLHQAFPGALITP